MAITNPFAQINASLPPLAPAPPPPLDFDPEAMNSSGPPQMPPSPGKKPQVFAPTPQDRQETMIGGRLEKDYQKDLHPWGSDDNHPGVWGKIAHGLSVATGGPNRRLMEEQGLEGRLNKLAELQSQDAFRGAETAKDTEETTEMPGKTQSEEGLQGAQTEEAKARTGQIQNPQDTNPDMATYRSLVKLGFAPREALQEIERDKALALKAPTGEHVNLMVNGKPAIGTYHPDTGKTTDAQGNEIANPQPYEKPAVSVNENHEFAENERGRALLDKAEGSYRTAQQGAQGIRAAVDDAMQGGKMSARMLPLEGALEITTANGVHRINRTEVDQYAGGGSLFDRIQGKISGLGTGVPFTPEIMQDMKHLADLQEKGAYDNYKGAYDSATHRYHLTDEKPLNGPSGNAGEGQGSGPPPGADVQVKGHDGKMYWGNSKTKQVLGPVQ